MRGSSIVKKLTENAKKQNISFHMPGHKNGEIYKGYADDYFSPEMISLDVTEIPGTDNLHAPKGIIKEAQDKAASFFGADHTFFLINGTSTGNISALMAVADPGDKVIIPRDCHKSVLHGLALGGLIPIYIRPEVDLKINMPMGIKPDTVEKAILENPDAKAVVITYPNYYGICSDIKQIAKIVHEYDKILIVDEAHGSHFILSDELPITALEAGADIVSQSTHKTLPSFTQSSMLHVKSERIDIERLRLMLMMTQSSSPSYLLMASLDAAREIIEQNGRKMMEDLLININEFEDRISNIPGLKKIGKGIIGRNGAWDFDSTRIVIDMTHIGLGGATLDDLLSKNYGIQMEMADINRIVAISNIANNPNDFRVFSDALFDIAKGRKPMKIKNNINLPSTSDPIMRLDPRTSVFAKRKEMLFSNSMGKISGEYIIPYPPGIPILCPGEEISQEIIEYIYELKNAGINIIGPKDEEMEYICIIEK